MNTPHVVLVVAFSWVLAQVVALVVFRVLGNYNSRRR